MKCPACKLDNVAREAKKHPNAMTLITFRKAIESYLENFRKEEFVDAMTACPVHSTERGIDATHDRIGDEIANPGIVKVPTRTADYMMNLARKVTR